MKHLAKLKEAFLKRSYQETIDDRFDRLNHQKQLTKKKRDVNLSSDSAKLLEIFCK